jgi:LysR family transcriptional regulator, low CO2-responsive transcriptional regulator
MVARLRVQDHRISVFPNERAAWYAAATGEGIAPAVEHLLARHAPTSGLSVLSVEGLPADLLWHVNMLGGERRSDMTTRLRRFLSTPDAMHAMFRADGRVPASRFKPPVYVTIWS